MAVAVVERDWQTTVRSLESEWVLASHSSVGINLSIRNIRLNSNMLSAAITMEREQCVVALTNQIARPTTVAAGYVLIISGAMSGMKRIDGELQSLSDILEKIWVLRDQIDDIKAHLGGIMNNCDNARSVIPEDRCEFSQVGRIHANCKKHSEQLSNFELSLTELQLELGANRGIFNRLRNTLTAQIQTIAKRCVEKVDLRDAIYTILDEVMSDLSETFKGIVTWYEQQQEQKRKCAVLDEGEDDEEAARPTKRQRRIG